MKLVLVTFLFLLGKRGLLSCNSVFPLSHTRYVFSSLRTSCWRVLSHWVTSVSSTSACLGGWTVCQRYGRSWALPSMWVSRTSFICKPQILPTHFILPSETSRDYWLGCDSLSLRKSVEKNSFWTLLISDCWDTENWLSSCVVKGNEMFVSLFPSAPEILDYEPISTATDMW